MAEGTSCGNCRVRFTMSLAAFDAHRVGPMDRRKCIPDFLLPAVGLWRDPEGRWGNGTAEGYEARQRQAALMRAAKQHVA